MASSSSPSDPITTAKSTTTVPPLSIESAPSSLPSLAHELDPLILWNIQEPYKRRIDLAHNEWKTEADVSERKVAAQYGVARTTLQGRNKGATSAAIRDQRRQRLCPEEESILVKWITRLQAWGWPARIQQVRFMAEDLLKDKGDTKDLGVHWTQRFMRRHKEIKTKYIPPLDKERALAQDPSILIHWFELYYRIKAEYQIQAEDEYNIDEKGFLQGVMGKLKVLISKHERNQHMTQCGSREWTTYIECVSLVGKALRPWIIFKAKMNQRAWHDAYPQAHIIWSENGWTDNELGLLWFQEYFAPESSIDQKGEYRLLLVDGHASHISTKTVQYCVDQKIILLCLPPHTTHLLQPLDVGIFAPVSTTYTSELHKLTRLGAGYSVDKVDFLRILCLTRNLAVTSVNIQKAWKACGLVPFDPQLILQHFHPKGTTLEIKSTGQYSITIRPISESQPNCPSTPLSKATSSSDLSSRANQISTPGNALQVQGLLKQALEGDDITKDKIIEKVGKSAIIAMADAVLQDRTNADLLAQAQRKEDKKKRTKGQVTFARVMNQEALDERQQIWGWEQGWNRINKIHKDYFGRQKMKKSHDARLALWQAAQESAASEAQEVATSEAQEVATSEAQAPTTSEAQVPSTLTAIQPAPPAPATSIPQPPATIRRRAHWELIVALPVRVIELEPGVWSLHQGANGQPISVEQPIEELGKGQRIRRPRRLS